MTSELKLDEGSDAVVVQGGMKVAFNASGITVNVQGATITVDKNGTVAMQTAANDTAATATPEIGAVALAGDHKGEIYGGILPSDKKPIWFLAVQWFFSFTPTAPVSDAQIRATQSAIRTNPEYRRGILERFSEDFLKMIPNRWRIYCLTPVPDSTLMWSHYGENHRGVCLEFSVDDPIFGFAQEVTYLSSYPQWAPHSLMSTDQPPVLLTKSDDWEYEREYRIIGLAEGVSRPVGLQHPLKVSDNFLRLGKGALQAVIAGCEADHEKIRATVQGIDPSLMVKRAVRMRSKYRLEIVE